MRPEAVRLGRLLVVGCLVGIVAAMPVAAQECAERRNIVLYFGVDLSGSMTGARQVAASNFGVALVDALSATTFLQTGGDFAFSNCLLYAAVISPDIAFLRADLAAVATAPTDLYCRGVGGTVVYDAIIAGAGVIYGQPTSTTRLYVLLTDGEHGGTPTTPANVAANLPPGVFTELILIAPPGSPGHSGLQAIASLAGSHVQVRATTDLRSLVTSIVNRTCTNFRPNAVMTISDNELRLGVEGFNITFNSSGSNDPDGSISSRTWTIRRPDSTSFTRNEALFTQTFDDSQLLSGDTWTVELSVTDNRGSISRSIVNPFRVVGSPPSITLSGGSIDVLQDIHLGATPTDDIDGGPLTLEWDVVASPAGSTHRPASAVQTGPTFTIDPTVETDIGTWTVRARARDDENQTDQEDITFEVRNLPPQIHLTGPTEIDVGETIVIETSHTTDRDGGDLHFTWDIEQSPDPSGIAPQTAFRTGTGAAGARLEIPTSSAHAGSWEVRLVARDNDHQPNSEVTATSHVLVDAPPEPQITGPDHLGSLDFPLLLDSRGSVDPDTDAPHSRLDGARPTVSGGIVERVWSLTDVPLGRIGVYPLGRVDEVFGVNAGGPELSLDFTDLETGDWTFQVDLLDAEGNEGGAAHRVAVIEANTIPLAITNGPQRYDVIGGRLDRAVVLDGSASFDLDNLLVPMPSLPGIDSYQWTVTVAPPGCPVLPLGAAAGVVIFPAGAAISIPCQGIWQADLAVTDDDTPALTSHATTGFIIGNCPELLCIDEPTEGIPRLIEVTDRTDVEIIYHVDSGIYSQPVFSGGIVARLDISESSAPATPIYTDYDFNPLATTLGGYNVFHWNGFSSGSARARAGDYDVHITLEDSLFSASTQTDQELRSIRIATAAPVLAATSDTIESQDRLRDGSAMLTFDFTVAGAAHPDALVLKIYDSSDAILFERTDLPAPAGTMSWNGAITPAMLISPGAYEAEIVATQTGAVLGTSARHPFLVVRSDLDVDTDRNATVADADDEMAEDAWTRTRGAIFSVNLDRDGGRTDGGVPVPDALDFDDSGTPFREDFTINGPDDALDLTPVVFRGIGAPLPAGVRVFLKAAELEDVQSMHVFKRIAGGEMAIWGALGTRAGQPSPPLEVDITPWVDPASPTFAGASGSGDVTFGLEGLLFRNLGTQNPFGGELDITMELRRGTSVLFSDTVRLKVAPWLMLPHTQPSREVWAVDDAANAAFRLNASAAPGYKGLDDSSQLPAGLPTTDSRWYQDHLETGYYQRPGGPKTIATFRLPYFRDLTVPQSVWPPQRLLRPGFATFQQGKDLGLDSDGMSNSGSYGGNVEILPPTATHPLGRIVIGTTRSDELWSFLDSQEVQAPITIPTNWLRVSHVDEVIAFHPAGTQVFVADPDGAFAALDAIPVVDRGRTVFFASGAEPVTGTVTGSPTMPGRLEVAGTDFTGTPWQYVRIFTGPAAGQVAHISGRGVGFLTVDQVWDTGTRIISDGVVANWASRWLLAPYTARVPPAWIRPPGPGDRFVLVERTQMWRPDGGVDVPAIVTVEEVLADPELRALNLSDARAEIDRARSALTAAAGALTFVEMPVIFVGERMGFATARGAVAYTPGLANVQPINGKLYFPRQFGPRDATGDIFENLIRSRVTGAEFVDDWDFYHRFEGEVHCGSTVVRDPLGLDWWDHQP